jgi:hypothetical protein
MNRRSLAASAQGGHDFCLQLHEHLRPSGPVVVGAATDWKDEGAQTQSVRRVVKDKARAQRQGQRDLP